MNKKFIVAMMKVVVLCVIIFVVSTFFIYDANNLLVYRGQLDDSRPGNGIPVTGTDIRKALDNLISNEPVSKEQRPSIGCNIKWK